MKELVRRGAGISMVPASFLEEDEQGIGVLSVPGTELRKEIVLICHKEYYRPPAAERFLRRKKCMNNVCRSGAAAAVPGHTARCTMAPRRCLRTSAWRLWKSMFPSFVTMQERAEQFLVEPGRAEAWLLRFTVMRKTGPPPIMSA